MHPGAIPVDADAVLGIDLFRSEFFLQRFDGPVGVFAAAFKLGFHDFVAGNLGDELADGFSGGGHELQDVGHAHHAVPAGNDAGIDDPAIAFAADDRSLLEHGQNDVGFADGRADDLACGGGGNVVDHSAAGEVGRGETGLFRQDQLGGQGQGIFFANISAVFINDGQTVGIGILRKADGGVLSADFIRQTGEIPGRGFRFVGELSVRRGVDVDELTAQFAQQGGGRNTAGTVHAVEHDLVSFGGNAQYVNVFEYSLDVKGVGFGVIGRGDQILDPAVTVPGFVVELLDAFGAGGGRRDGDAGQELDAVPLNRIVRSGDDGPGIGVEVFDHHGHARCRHHAQVDDLDAAGDQARDGRIADPRPAGAGIPSDDNAEVLAVGGGFGFVEPDGKSRNHLVDYNRGKRATDGATHSGDADH